MVSAEGGRGLRTVRQTVGDRQGAGEHRLVAFVTDASMEACLVIEPRGSTRIDHFFRSQIHLNAVPGDAYLSFDETQSE